MMRRRQFLELSAMAGAAIAAQPIGAARSAGAAPLPEFPDKNLKWETTWDAALEALTQNVAHSLHYQAPVLIEGAGYQGIWLEGAPMEALMYAGLDRYIPRRENQPSPAEVARANHSAFFTLQREDGQLPAYIYAFKNEIGFDTVQMVVPIAATAWELAQQTRDEEFLEISYRASSRWDAWLRRYRDTRQTGLVEGFCTWDTGMDHSPRWAGMPDHCPDGDARKCPALPSLPRLCPDLSASVYGGRVALSAMAKALGKTSEANRWIEDAEKIRKLILDRLYCAEDAAFYDVDAHGQFVRVRSILMARVLGEHVLNLAERGDRQIFEDLWTRQLHNPAAFWPPYPFPSVAVNDPAFVRPIPTNSWGGASQALTALRATRWMAHYGKQKEFTQLVHQWLHAILQTGTTTGQFLEQIDPATGEFSPMKQGGYSPTALLYLDFVKRLADTSHLVNA
jgi:hypothetical protein